MLAPVRFFFLRLRVARLMGLCLTLRKNCLGQDNPSDSCTVGDVKNIFEGNLGDHDGPYAGITMGC
jgi:hypothetical protein